MILSEDNSATAFSPLNKHSNVLLTTFRQSGERVGTPVGFGVAHEKLYFTTRQSTWKVKRIAKNPYVTVAPCTPSGKLLGQEIAGVARRLNGEETERAHEVMNRSMSWGKRIWGWMFIQFYKIIAPGDQWLMYEVTPVERETIKKFERGEII